ncbi:unnamed protein product [Somion occarium]|uniref:Uncharacterized protein n=1 Tax=Somion occarium TaxID=3059160 RepID=A0ABP1CGP0_9APHY
MLRYPGQTNVPHQSTRFLQRRFLHLLLALSGCNGAEKHASAIQRLDEVVSFTTSNIRNYCCSAHWKVNKHGRTGKSVVNRSCGGRIRCRGFMTSTPTAMCL